MVTLKTGELKSRVTFQANQPVIDTATNRRADNYVDIMTRFGRLRMINGKRGLEGLRPDLIGKWELILRYETALLNILWKDMRVKHGSKVFAIDSAPERDKE